MQDKQSTFLRWNMRDTGYGFKAIENRVKVLGIERAYMVPGDKKLTFPGVSMKNILANPEPIFK
ncbi:MAG: hypothetical protein FWG82_01405 [Oscillospiraceae bacterium]|nr:hypothetical protein [Oscillospiraceae bacterium]